jgi:hypothetical protein
MLLFKIIISILAFIGFFNHELAWRMGEGWKYKNVEPRESYLKASRIGAIAVLIIVWLFFPNG